MEPEHLRFGGGATDTMIHPLVAVYLLIVIVLIIILPRGKAIVPFLLAFFTIPVGQVIVLGGFHFTALRILILAGLARMVSSQRAPSGDQSGDQDSRRFKGVDSVVILWALSAAIVFCVQWRTVDSLVNSLGTLVDTLAGYLVVRFLIPDFEAMRRAIKALALVAAINGLCMINEKISHFNVFGLLGGIPLEVTVRDGSIRSNGVMGYIWAGTMGGTLTPLFVWLWTEGKSRSRAGMGLIGAMTMAMTSSSSTSLLALGGSLLALFCWPLRKQMRMIRWMVAITLVGLHLVMKAPVWALIARVDLTGSSSGDHRYHLMDMTIRHFSDWWLIGYRYYDQWGWDSWDLSNQFVAVAMTGGLITLIFYIAIFTRSFGAIGAARKRVDGDLKQEWLLWCLGSALFANMVAHFGINYPAHLIMSVFPLLCSISVATSEATLAKARTADTPDSSQLALAPNLAKTHSSLGSATREARRFSRKGKERSMPWLKA